MGTIPPEEGGAIVRAEPEEQARATEQRLQRERVKLNHERRMLQRERELQQFQTRVTSEKKPTFDHLEHTDKSRKHIAFVFVYGYIAIVTLILVGLPLYNWIALSKPMELDLDKTLAQVGALIGSPLGFVVGYYFKEDSRH